MLSKLIIAVLAGFAAGVYCHEGQYGMMVAVLGMLIAIYLWVMERKFTGFMKKTVESVRAAVLNIRNVRGAYYDNAYLYYGNRSRVFRCCRFV